MKIYILSMTNDLLDLRRYLEDEFELVGLHVIRNPHKDAITIDACDVCIGIIDRSFESSFLNEFHQMITEKKRGIFFVRNSVLEAREIYQAYLDKSHPFLKSNILSDIRVFRLIEELTVNEIQLFRFSEPKDIVSQVCAQLGYRVRYSHPSVALVDDHWPLLDDLTNHLENRGLSGGMMDSFAIDANVGVPWLEKMLSIGLHDTHLRIAVIDEQSAYVGGLVNNESCSYRSETLTDRVRRLRRLEAMFDKNRVKVEIRKIPFPYSYHGVICGDYLYYTPLTINNGVLATTKPFLRIRRGDDLFGDNLMRSFVSWFELFWRRSEHRSLVQVGKIYSSDR